MHGRYVNSVHGVNELMYALLERDRVHDGSQTTIKPDGCCSFDFVAICAASTAPSYAPRERTRRIHSCCMFSVWHRLRCGLSFV